jgi:hypothetical protein
MQRIAPFSADSATSTPQESVYERRKKLEEWSALEAGRIVFTSAKHSSLPRRTFAH